MDKVQNSKSGFSSFKSIIIFAGGYISYYFGSGYATGQDLMQYYLRFADGWHFLFGSALALIIFWYYNWSFSRAGSTEKFAEHSDIFCYYCGKVIGKVFDLFIVASCALCYMVMCSGAAATMSQQFNVPLVVGGAAFCVIVVATNVFGLRGILKVLGLLGPILIIGVFVISLLTVIRDHAAISEGFRLIHEGKLGQISIGPNLWIGAIFHSTTVVSWFAAFSAELGERSDMKELRKGLLLCCCLLFAASAVGSLSLIANIKEVATVAVPNLILANKLSPIFGKFFSIIILGGIYTTAVPLLWATSTRFAKDATNKFRVITLLVGAISMAVALRAPYRNFYNMIYTVCAYTGALMVVLMLIKDIRLTLLAKDVPTPVSEVAPEEAVADAFASGNSDDRK